MQLLTLSYQVKGLTVDLYRINWYMLECKTIAKYLDILLLLTF